MNRRIRENVLLVIIVLFIASCANAAAIESPQTQLSQSHKEVINEQLKQIQTMTKILVGIKDEKSANDAVDPLASLVEKMKATYENLESSLSQDLYEHIDVEYGAKFESSFNRLSKELMRIMHQEELSKPLEKVLGNIEQLFPGLLAQGRDIEPNVRFVVVDQREPAFVVFTGIAKETNEEELEEIRSKIANLERVTMVTWDSFMATIDKYAQSVMLRNDYPDIHIMDGLVCLVASKQGSGAPWGLTWNGGIALTFNDYEHARRTFKSYKADPDSYKSASDPRRDPIHPAGKLAFGGCN